MPSSEAHEHFITMLVLTNKRDAVEERRVCAHCRKVCYGLKTGTGTLMTHIKNAHDGAPPPPALPLPSSSCSSSSSSSPSESSSAAPPSKRQRLMQGSLSSSLVVFDNPALRVATSTLFARFSWPHHAVDSPEFAQFIEAARHSSCPGPSRYQLGQDHLTHVQHLRTLVVRQLKSCCRASPLSIAVDGWTNVNSAKVTNVVILAGGNAYYWCSIVNGSHHNTAVWLTGPLVEVLKGIRAEGLLFTSLVADNEKVNKALWGLLVQSFPFLVRSPCAAHLLQLCVNKALELPCIDELFTEMELLLRQYRYKEARLKLKALQLANPLNTTGPPVGYRLLRPQTTRWSSWLYAAQRLLKVKAYVDIITPQPARFWSELIELVRFLKPFQLATDLMQQDTSTLYDVYRQFMTVLQHVRALDTRSFFHPSKEDITNIIIDMWEKHINLDAIVICAQLSFDSSMDAVFPDKILQAQRWFQEFAAKYAVFWHISEKTDIVEVRKLVLAEWSDFVGRSMGTCFDRLDDDVASLRSKFESDQQRFQPRAVWNLYLAHSPLLSHAAVAILSVCGSEAAVERTFSAQGLVHSDLRNRLGDATVEAEMFIKFNKATVTRVDQRGQKQHRKRSPDADAFCEEMGDDDKGDEPPPSIAGVFSRPKPPQQPRPSEEKANAEEHAQSASEAEEKSEAAPAQVIQVPRAPAATDVQAFIEHYIAEHGVTIKYRWTDYRLQQLEAAGQAWRPPMKDTDVVLKKKIMAWLRDQDAEDEAAQGAENIEL